MGGPSVAICLEELARMGIKKLIRFGTTGTIQEKVNLGDIIVDKAAVRLDGTSQHYAPLEFPAVASFEVTTHWYWQPRMPVRSIIWALRLQRHLLAGTGALRQLHRLCTAPLPWDDAGMAGAGRAEL